VLAEVKNMKNTKSALNLFVMTGLGLSFSLLTACGGGSSNSAETVTTLPNCTTSSVYNEGTKTWSLSTTDASECAAITTVPQNVTCDSNSVKVRIPVTGTTALNNEQTCIWQNGVQYCGTVNNNNNNNNYHSNIGSYEETCMNTTSAEWGHIVNAGSYYYYNYNAAHNDYQGLQYQYQYTYNKQLSPEETIIAFGVVAAALFFLNN